MYKEAFAGILLLALFYFIYKKFRKKKPQAAAVLLAVLLLFSCAANLIYNAVVMFPDFYMDIVNGRFRYGTFSGNLFAYSDEFMFQDEILFPILKNRHVSLDSSADFYEKFFSLYSSSCDRIEITEAELAMLNTCMEDFDFSHEFSCIGIMDYAADEIPEALTSSFDEEIYPDVYINTASLKEDADLIVLMDTDYTLYIMGKTYYQNILNKNRTGGNYHA